MDYATTDNWAATPAPKQKAKTAAPKRRAVPAEPRAQERQRSRTFRPPAICPAGAAAYGFLTTRFLPHYTGQPARGSSAEKEKEGFYRSFALLCSHYGILTVVTKGLAYPYGREVALHEASRLLRDKLPQHITIEPEENDGDFILKVREHFDTRNTLFYIPVAPLYFLMKDRRRKKAAQLLLCVFSYLYRIAGIPYHTDDSSYLYWHYDMLTKWVNEDPGSWEDEKEYNSYVREINTALHIGEVTLRRLWNPIHLEHFEMWLNRCKPADAFGNDCHHLAQKFYTLWQEYPQGHSYSHADPDGLPDPEQDYDDNDCITMDKYISFVAATHGRLYNNLEQSVNNEFGECVSIQEPVLKRCFDGQEQHDDTLDYECRLFPLINKLCYLLNNCDYDT